MKRFRALTTRHPILSQLAGWLLLLVIMLALAPKDPDVASAPQTHSWKNCV